MLHKTVELEDGTPMQFHTPRWEVDPETTHEDLARLKRIAQRVREELERAKPGSAVWEALRFILSSPIEKAQEEPTWESMTEIRAPIQIAINDLWAARSHLAQSQQGDALQGDIERSTMTVKLPKDHENTFCGLTFICPICGGRNCVWRRLRRQGRTWIDEHYCTNTGHTLQAEDLLASLKVDHDEPLPAFIEFHLGEQAAHKRAQ